MSPALSYFILFVIVVPFLAYFYRRYKASTAYSWQQQPADPEYAGKIRGGLLEEAEQEVPFEGYLNSHKLPEPPQERARGPSPLPPPKKVVQLTARQPPQGGEWVSKKELENAIFSVKMATCTSGEPVSCWCNLYFLIIFCLRSSTLLMVFIVHYCVWVYE